MSEVGASPVFDRLSDPVRAALTERGFTEPTEPQRRAIPPLAAGRDALVIAPTGTGKTETAMLPVFDAICRHGTAFGISALYITPLRALNRDMLERLSWWGDTLDIEVDVRHGDTTRYRRTQQANDPPDVLITTPETLQAMLTGKKLRRALEDVDHVVVDEVHELAASKRGAQLSIGLERLRELAGEFQRIGLSATVGDPDAVGRFLTGGDEPERVEIDAGSRIEVRVHAPEITEEDERLAAELATEPAAASHARAIAALVEANDSTLIFVNTRQSAEALGSRFRAMDADVGVHHGSLSKDTRIDVEERFKAGEIDALLCTSSMELGIDVGRVDHVVQYGSPREVARLLQRVGRAGHRADRVSRGTIIARDPDDTLEALAIVRQSAAGEVEPAAIHEGSLDVVANQVAGLVMDLGEVSGRRAYEVVRRAYPFRDLSEESFREVVRELAGNRVVWLDEDEDRISKRDGSWQYFYANLSTIPDEESYDVYDVASGRQIGTLDEKFVVEFAEPGATFVQRGEMWRIAEVDEEEDRVNATPVEDPDSEIPSWVGAEIPVPFAVAQEVGRMRDVAAAQLAEGADLEAVAGSFVDRYAADRRTLCEALRPIARHLEAGHPVPTDDRIVVEQEGGTVVIDVAGGHRVNETLGRLCAALIGQATGSSVGMEADPYRVTLELPRGTSRADVVEVLTDTDPDHIATLVELSLKHADVLKFTLVQVAATFGALKRWRGSGRGMGSSRLLEALRGTPIYDEAVRTVLHEELDVAATGELLGRIQAGEVALEAASERTPLGIAPNQGARELLTPDHADASVIEAVRERLHGDRVRLVCVHCGDWTRRTKVRRVPDRPECPACGSTRIAALSPWADEVVDAVQAASKSDEQVELTRRAHRVANLVQSHGKKAVIALAGRGVGPQSAARIINNWREDEDDFYRDILAREREYARTKAFWD